MDAHERADVDALAALLREDARLDDAAAPDLVRRPRRDRGALRAQGFDPDVRRACAASRPAPTAAGGGLLPAARRASRLRPLAFDVLRIEDGRIAEITSFVFPELFEAFGLPSDEFLARASL